MPEIIILVLCVSLGIVLRRALVGPTAYDRILAANTFGGQIVALIALLSIVFDAMVFIDLALIYALINFIATVGFMRFFTSRSFGDNNS